MTAGPGELCGFAFDDVGRGVNGQLSEHSGHDGNESCDEGDEVHGWLLVTVKTRRSDGDCRTETKKVKKVLRGVPGGARALGRAVRAAAVVGELLVLAAAEVLLAEAAVAGGDGGELGERASS